jgi:hypothetical protein
MPDVNAENLLCSAKKDNQSNYVGGKDEREESSVDIPESVAKCTDEATLAFIGKWDSFWLYHRC